MKEQFLYRGHEVKVIDTWVDPDNNKKGVTIEPVGDYGFQIDVYLDDLKKRTQQKQIGECKKWTKKDIFTNYQN